MLTKALGRCARTVSNRHISRLPHPHVCVSSRLLTTTRVLLSNPQAPENVVTDTGKPDEPTTKAEAAAAVQPSSGSTDVTSQTTSGAPVAPETATAASPAPVAPETAAAASEAPVAASDAPVAASDASATVPESAAAAAEAAPAASGAGVKAPVSWATFVLIAAVGGVLVAYYNIKREQKRAQAATKVETYGKALLGGPWSLVDSEGVPVTSGDLLGKYYLAYFGFTFCPDICPNELVKMGQVVDMLEKKGGTVPPVIPVFITLDPYRDSCAQVGLYARDFHSRMLALTGTPGQVAKIAKAFRVYFAEVDKQEDDEDYLVDHSIVMYLMGPDGEFIDFFTQLMTAPEIAEKIASKIKTVEPPSSIDRFLATIGLK